jgi:hypothetical protein
LVDDFTQLNERFIKSCRDYEHLLDASMTQQQPSYQYGRVQGQGYGGGYPPQAAPPQQDPQRYYPPPGPQQHGKQFGILGIVLLLLLLAKFNQNNHTHNNLLRHKAIQSNLSVEQPRHFML